MIVDLFERERYKLAQEAAHIQMEQEALWSEFTSMCTEFSKIEKRMNKLKDQIRDLERRYE